MGRRRFNPHLARIFAHEVWGVASPTLRSQGNLTCPFQICRALQPITVIWLREFLQAGEGKKASFIYNASECDSYAKITDGFQGYGATSN